MPLADNFIISNSNIHNIVSTKPKFIHHILQFIKNTDPIGEWIESNIIKTTIKNDKINNNNIERGRRISITFRNVT